MLQTLLFLLFGAVVILGIAFLYFELRGQQGVLEPGIVEVLKLGRCAGQVQAVVEAALSRLSPPFYGGEVKLLLCDCGMDAETQAVCQKLTDGHTVFFCRYAELPHMVEQLTNDCALEETDDL